VNVLKLPLASSAVDRSGELRTDERELARLWDGARILHFASGKFRVKSNFQLDFQSAQEISELRESANFASGQELFLGIDNGIAYFAWCSDAIVFETFEEEENYQTLRSLGDYLSELEMGLAIHAQAIANWHHTHQFCSRCGQPTLSANGGSLRKCTSDGSEHYPRTDGAVIVLVRDSDDRVLLGRQKIWPELRFSCFAGFVEPGESFEQTVMREVFEESGIKVEELNYLGSQPWPFPASIMISFSALATNPNEARPDGEEIVEIIWLTRGEMRSAIAENTLTLPPPMSVARKMIEFWYEESGADIRDLVSK
jgi:NAD+ diphosphatase|tara:strand:+ start:642 stop:1577 length:936 start_codon:yes stop_codon:yes gene_type:complete